MNLPGNGGTFLLSLLFRKTKETQEASRRFIHDEKNILLLDTTMTSGYCQEYYSYAIYAALQQKGVACNYIDSVGAYNEKYVKLNHGGYTLDFDDEQFTVYNADEIIIAEIGDFQEALDKLCELASTEID